MIPYIKQTTFFFFSVFTIIIVIGCSSEKQSNDGFLGSEIIRIDPNSRQREKFALSKITDSITYIPLETNDHCLLGTIRTNFIFSENYILLDNTNDILYLFSKTGRFIAQIGKIGNGPGEYLHYGVDLARIDEQNRWVIITASNPNRVMYYDFKGEFIKSNPLPSDNVMGYIEPYHNFYLVKNPNCYGKVQNTYTVLDTAFNIVTRAITPVQYSLKSDGSMTMSHIPSFSQYTYNDQVYVRENLLNDTLYVINDNFSFMPKYIINSGKYEVPVDVRSDARFFLKEMMNYVMPWSIFETNDYLLILYEYQNKRIPCFYHKKEKKLIHIASSYGGIPNDFDGGFDFWPVYQNNKKMIAFYDANQFVEHKQNRNKLKLQGGEDAIKHFDQMVQTLEPDDNPVMVIVTLK